MNIGLLKSATVQDLKKREIQIVFIQFIFRILNFLCIGTNKKLSNLTKRSRNCLLFSNVEKCLGHLGNFPMMDIKEKIYKLIRDIYKF